MAWFRKMLPIYVAALCLTLFLAVFASESVTVLTGALEPGEASTNRTVIVDPGHGGEDGGAVSSNGVLESTINLEISLRLRDLLNFLGVPVRMTRETDCSIYGQEAQTVSEKKVSDLKNRVRLVNALPNALLVSIHQNMFPESKYYGTQVFYARAAGSQELAESMQARFCTALDPTNRRMAALAQNVYLMNQIHCPGILIECGFLSNPREEQLLQEEAYQIKIAAVIAAELSSALLESGVS